MTIFYETRGNGEDVVLLHGNCHDHHSMAPLMDLLCKRYRVTTVDMPGNGKSNWQPRIQNSHDIADILLPVLPECATYINWSFGGLIATSIAARYPKRVKRIINIGSIPKFIEDVDWPAIPKPGFHVTMIPLIAEQGFTHVFKDFYATEFANFNPKPESYNLLINNLEDMAVNLTAINKYIHIADEADLRKEFQALDCPIDLIVGEDDTSVPVEIWDKVKQLNPRTNFHIISDARHMLQWTHPVEFGQILEKILQN